MQPVTLCTKCLLTYTSTLTSLYSFSGVIADSSGVWQEGGDDEEAEELEVNGETKGQYIRIYTCCLL